MVCCLVAVVVSSVVSATIMDLEMVVDTVRGSGGRGGFHTAGSGQREQNWVALTKHQMTTNLFCRT